MQTAKFEPHLLIPSELQEALRSSPAAAKEFEDLAPSHRKEYVEWICSAKQEKTRRSRAGKAVQMLCQEKSPPKR